MAGITTLPCVIFFFMNTPYLSSPSWQDYFFGHNREWLGTNYSHFVWKNMKLKYLTYNDWVWRNIKIAKYFYNVEWLRKEKVCIWEKYEPFCGHIKLTPEISARHWLSHKTLHWETSTQYKVLWQNKVLTSQEL